MSTTNEIRRCACPETIYARELSHRTANVLQQAIAVVHFGRRGGTGLDAALRQLTGAADLHRLLGEPASGMVEIADLLERACWSMASAAGAGEDIRLDVGCDAFIADAFASRPVLILATELVANAIKHAFPDGRGSIMVALRDDGMHTSLVVEDDGVCSGWWRPGGQGLGIIDALASSAGGSVTRTLTPGGSSRIEVLMPSIAALAATIPLGTT